MKTTVNLDDDLYKRLVKEAVERYGNTKNLSKLINEKLATSDHASGRAISNEVKERMQILKGSAGGWKTKGSGKEYVRQIRKGWNKRLKTAGL